MTKAKTVMALNSMVEPDRKAGVVRTLKSGYGFIRTYRQDIPRSDYFFHSEDVTGVKFHSLEVGDIVSFETLSDDRGERAVDVCVEIENHFYNEELS